jgi:exopolyphosphatase/guanosine-5'-triphosphate,3'-diphosphate pyrophosphatase
VRLLSGQLQEAEWTRMRRWVEALPPRARPTEAIGTGGNISKIYDLAVGTPGATLGRRRVRDVVRHSNR